MHLVLSYLEADVFLVTELPAGTPVLEEREMFSPVLSDKSSQRGKQMRSVHVPQARVSEVQDILRSFHEHQRLVKLVSTMTLEIERLNEDNVQLHAAVKIYREVVRRCHGRALSQ
jgi:hypothetical protein